MVGSIAAPDAGWLPFVQNLVIGTFALIPIAIGIAVLRYRLYEIDVVVRKAVIVAAMTALFTVVYVAIVGGVGAAVGASSTPALSFAAAAVVALLFQPALVRARRFADRVVYGKRATPYEVLSAFSERVAETYADEDVLPRMAHVLADAVGADRADVWLRIGEQLTVSASWPTDAVPHPSLRMSGDDLPSLPSDASFPVEHQGELLGALTVEMPANDPLDPARSKLVDDLASQAGLVLRNVRLTEDLRARFDDLKAAQKRLVAAQDQERRRLERNIHDGAQQQLVALAVKLRLAEGLVAKDPGQAETMLQELRTETQDALEDLRDLARGIYPPLVGGQGPRGRVGDAGEEVGRARRGLPRRRRPIRARDRGGRLLLGPRGAAERREVRAGGARFGRAAVGGGWTRLRGRGRREGIRSGVERLRHGVAGHRGSPGGARWHPRGHERSRGRNEDRRQDPDRSRVMAKRSVWRRFERWIVGVVMAVIAFVLEKAVLRSVRKGETTARQAKAAPSPTAITSKGGDVDL